MIRATAERPDIQARYLQRARGATLHVRMLDGETLGGTLLGWDAYTFLLRIEGIGAVVISKHATAYLATATPAEGPAEPGPCPGGHDWLREHVGRPVRIQLMDGRAASGILGQVGRYDLLLLTSGRQLLVRLAAVAIISERAPSTS